MSKVPKIGAFVLESLTTGMYTEPLDAVREFIQNAADSIRAAEEQGLIREGHGRIEIIVDPKERALRIRDNGVGIPQDKVVSSLIDIGMSAKDIAKDAGFRGIGRLAGIAYCDELKFTTSAAGETSATEVYLDCKEIRQAFSPSMRQVEQLADVIANNSCDVSQRCASKMHFFEVAMCGITHNASAFLDWRRLEEYLSQVAPVPFDAQRFLFAPTIRDWVAKHGLSIPTVTLLIETPRVKREVFKPYKGHYKTALTKGGQYPIEIKGVRFFPEDPSPDSPFWLWFGETDLLGRIDDPRAAGLRLRKHNISLGGAARPAELFAQVAESNRRFNAYYIGEIHVVTPGAIPNARRDGFEDLGAWPEIKEALAPFIRERCEEIRETSRARSRPVAKVIASAQKVIEDAKERIENGLVSKKERDNLLERVQKEHTRAKAALRTRKRPEDAKKVKKVIRQLGSLEETLEHFKDFAVRKVRPDLDRKQRRILRDVLKIINEKMAARPCPKRDECYRLLRSAILEKFQVAEDKADS